MASWTRRKLFSVKHPVMVDMGCSCRGTRLSSFCSSSSTKPTNPKSTSTTSHTPSASKRHHHPLCSRSSSFSPPTTATATTSPWDTSFNHSSSSIATTTTTLYEMLSSSSPIASPEEEKAEAAAAAMTTHKGRVAKESVAVVKESEDPYHDFRDSMLSMILEKEIFAWDDLRELLHSFLSLNNPYHHEAIVQAFAEIWELVFSSPSDRGPQPPPPPPPQPRPFSPPGSRVSQPEDTTGEGEEEVSRSVNACDGHVSVELTGSGLKRMHARVGTDNRNACDCALAISSPVERRVEHTLFLYGVVIRN